MDLKLTIAALLAGAAIAFVARALFGSIRLKRRFARGARAEEKAAALAVRRGYRILGTQVPGEVTVRVDGEARPVRVRADMLLARGFRRFIAEVKSGAVAPDPTSSATRRQLLEYTHAFEADGLLLFDMERGRIHEIRFGRRFRIGRLAGRAFALCTLLLGGAVIEHQLHAVDALAAWLRLL